MLYCNFSLNNPWHKKDKKGKDYKNLFLKHGRLTKNKHWELESHKDQQRIVSFELSLSFRNKDHAGLEIGLGICGVDIAFRIYDTRHWDYENNQWIDINKNKQNINKHQNEHALVSKGKSSLSKTQLNQTK